ncbi:MAG: Tfp pilus assembly protein FimT/FimU [Gemmatimonadaceae bacterium]
MRRPSVSPAATTLPELAVALVLVAIILGIAVPHVRHVVERAAVRGAVADIVTTLSTARQVAASNGGGVAVLIDTSTATIRVLHRGDTIVTRPLQHLFGVTLRTTRDSLAFDARGLGSGAANLTFVIVRGITADTVVVSRLGRVRW